MPEFQRFKQIISEITKNKLGLRFEEEEVWNLFNSGEIEMKSGVDPSEDLRSTDEISRIHHPDIRRHFVFLIWFWNQISFYRPSLYFVDNPTSLVFSIPETDW